MSGTTGTIPLNTVAADQLITSAERNAELANIGALMDAAGCGGHSDTDADAQIQTNPYPGSVLSKATSIAGELERLRYQLAQILGTDFWYKPAATNLTSVGDVVVPVGGVIDFPSATPPSASWHLADGTAISRASYSALFALIGTSFGVGDGSSTFNIPDYRDRMSIGAGNLYAVAAQGGSILSGVPSITVTDPGHTHTQNAHTHTDSGHVHSGPSHTHSLSNITNGTIGGVSHFANGTSTGAEGTGNTGSASANISSATATNNSNTTGITASAPAVSVLNPYLAMYKMIRVL